MLNGTERYEHITSKFRKLFLDYEKKFLAWSDENETCENTKERLYPKVTRKISMRKNRRVKDDEDDDDSEAETRKMHSQDMDWTVRDPYTHSYHLARRGKVTLTENSFECRAVYRHRRFITVMVKNFYQSARCIPYDALTRCDGVGGVVGRVFLFKAKRLERMRENELVFPTVDLNELMRWGQKGIIFGDRMDRNQEVVPFEVSQGGRIKKFAEDKILDVVTYTDEFEFFRQKDSMHMHMHMFSEAPLPPVEKALVGKEGNSVEDEDGNESEYSTGERQLTGNLLQDMMEALVETENERKLAQVNLRVAAMQIENEERLRAGGVYANNLYDINNVVKLKLLFNLGEFERMRLPSVPYDQDGNVIHVEQEEKSKLVWPTSAGDKSHDTIYFSDSRLDESFDAEIAAEVQNLADSLGIDVDLGQQVVSPDHTYGCRTDIFNSLIPAANVQRVGTLLDRWSSLAYSSHMEF